MEPQLITLKELPLAGLRKGLGHKFSYGHAIIVSGGSGRSGAARLAARAALRIGAGLVTIAVPPDAHLEVASQISSLMVRRASGRAELVDLLRDDRMNAICVGPGLGVSAKAAQMVDATLASKRFSVLDADALTLMAQDRKLFGAVHEHCVMTPHGGEFARLFPDLSVRLAAENGLSKAEAAVEASQRAGCILLLKGAQTVVAQPDGQVARHVAEGARAAPWLATAGSGDVLAGLVTGLMARGFAPFQAAKIAVHLHVDAALIFGPGLIAEDLPEQIPAVLRKVFDEI